MSPTHIGVVSLLFVHGSFSTELSAESDHADRMRAPAAVVAPLTALLLRPLGRERDCDVLVGDAAPIGRIRAGECARDREKLRQTAGRPAPDRALEPVQSRK